MFQTETVCPDCNGHGHTFEKKCTACGGDGIVSTSKTITLRVPRGVEDGDTMRKRFEQVFDDKTQRFFKDPLL